MCTMAIRMKRHKGVIRFFRRLKNRIIAPRRGGDEILIRKDDDGLERLRNDAELRKSTFATWPKWLGGEGTARLFFTKGFAYMGVKDTVQCVYCGGMLSDWELGDVVEIEHAHHFPDCKNNNADDILSDRVTVGESVGSAATTVYSLI